MQFGTYLYQKISGCLSEIPVENYKLEVWDWHTHTTIYKLDNQQGPTVQHRGLFSIFCNNLWGKKIWKKEYMPESLCCTPQTNTTL